MKKFLKTMMLVSIVMMLAACNKKFEGYWCKYDETATIVVLMNDNATQNQRNLVESTVNNYQNLESLNYYTKEDYANELGVDPSSIDIYDTFVLIFNSMDSIGTYIEELEQINGVKEAKQSNAKSNISLYNLKAWNKYEYTDSDEPNEKDIIKGKYKMKNGVITFTPDDKKKKVTMLYIKDDHLCADVDCNEIYFASDDKCSATK